MKKTLFVIILAMCTFVSGAQDFSYLMFRDWAGYNKYGDANKTIMTAPKAVFLGDSIFEFWFNQDPAFFNTNNFLCRGIGGQTTCEILCRMRPDAIDLHPEFLVLMCGTNDFAMNNGYISIEHSFGNLVSMCELAKVNGMKVLLCSVPPATGFNWRPQVEPKDLVPILNRMLKDYAAKTDGVTYVDFFSALAAPDNSMDPANSDEGCHPNATGYAKMKEIILKAMKNYK